MSQQTIHILNENTVNQIAAGEVVENPASVIKELVENSLDANASEISIETGAGGRRFIHVADNGRGMSSEDLMLCLERHATSKLSSVDGLNSLHSLGFRGEALPSIASISKMTLHSCMESGRGHQLKVEGGKLGSIVPLPRQRGTSIIVQSLFFNVPVRKRFQKSVGWDIAAIHKVITHFALGYPEVAFTWINDSEQVIRCSQSDDLKARIHSLLGEEIISHMLPVEHSLDSLRLSGWTGRPSLHRPNKKGHYLLINKRFVHSPFVSKNVLEGYGTRLPSNRFPCFVLHLTLPLSWVDVNVHPQKTEVRLGKEEEIGVFLADSIERALSQNENLPKTAPIDFSNFKEHAPLVVCEKKTEYRATESVDEPVLVAPNVQILGKVGHYLFVEHAEGINMIDSKRALERIIYDSMQHSKEVQTLLLPVHVSFCGKEKEHLLDQLEPLNQLGVGIRHFGADTFIVDAIPAVLEPDEIQELIAAYLEEGQLPKQIGKCLKRGKISKELGAVVVEKLMKCKDAFFTPTGKKIQHLMDEKALKKLLL